MNSFRHSNKIFLLVAMACPFATFAEDTDIFLTNPNVVSGRPNLLLMLDNAASNNSNVTLLDGSSGKKLEMLRQVLTNIIDPLNSTYFPSCNISGESATPKTPRVPAGCVTRAEVYALLNGINLGLMIANPSGSDKGGYVRYHIRPMNLTANQSALLAKISPEIPTANNAPYAKSMHEAYLYYGGKSLAYAGFSSAEYDAAAKIGTGYNSPISDSCQKNYIVFVGNGGPDSGEENDTNKLLGGIGSTAVTPTGVLTSDPVSFSPNNSTSSWFDEYARTLFKRDVATTVAGTQNVITYTIAVQNPADNNYATAPVESSRKLLESAATLGGGEYFEASDGQKVMKAFVDLLQKMQPEDSVFSASTLPVSVNVRGAFLNQVYMGQFRPDEGAGPRWPGNLKQYKIALDLNGNPFLADSSSPRKPVEDKANGFLLSDITSFWSTVSSYWSFDPMGNPASDSDAPDGSVVEKGGAAQRLRTTYATSQAARKLYTCNGACVAGALSDVLFNDANTSITASGLGAASAAERTAIIDWVRGADNIDNEDGNGVSTDIRPRIHGDLVHSRPAVVNYNRTAGDRDVVVYYGANNGVFHAVKGGQDSSDGFEKWGMVFPEHLGGLKRLRDNDPDISSTAPKPYFADGPVTVYQKDSNSDGKIVAADGDKAYLYIGMRRGGRFAYALDVSDPDVPKYLWKISNASTSFSELGQTWSALRPAKIRAEANDPVVIFGAGYDPENEDVFPATTNDKGRGIFVVNGRTGAFIKHIQPSGMASVTADLAVIDRDNNGLFDRIYAVDTKANLWRIDIDDADKANWQSYKIASLAGSGTDARKFLGKPDVVLGDDFDVVLFGSGDRERPFDTTIANRFYMLKDTNVGLTGGLICSSTAGTPPVVSPRACTEADLVNTTTSTSPLPVDAHGWYITMAAGEKVVSSAVTVFGTTFFSTNMPKASDPGVCASNLGVARLYAVGYETGKASLDLNSDGVVNDSDLFEDIAGGGYPPSPVSSRLEDGTDVVCTGAKCFSPGKSTSSTERYRTHWYIEQ